MMEQNPLQSGKQDANYCKPKGAETASLAAFERCFQGVGSSSFEMKCCGKRNEKREGFMILSIPIRPEEVPRHVEGKKTELTVFIQRKNWFNIFSSYPVRLTADERMTVRDFKVFVCRKLGFDALRFRTFKFDGKGPAQMVREHEQLIRSFDGKELLLVEDFVLAGFEIPLSSEQHNEHIENGSYTLAYVRFKDCYKYSSFKPVFVDSTDLLAANLWTAAYQLFEDSGNTISRYFNFNDYVESPEYDFSFKLVVNGQTRKLDYHASNPVVVPASGEIEVDVLNSSMRTLRFVREATFLHGVQLQLDEVINPYPLQQILAELYSPEQIDDYNCEACKKKTVCLKQEKLKHLPVYLVIHLNKLQMNWEYQEMLKTDRYIDIPLDNLDLTAAVDLEEGEAVPPYELVAVIHHVGNHSEGHYTASCRSRSGEQWHHFDDEKTRELSGSGLALSSAYLLVYRQRARVACTE